MSLNDPTAVVKDVEGELFVRALKKYDAPWVLVNGSGSFYKDAQIEGPFTILSEGVTL